MQADKSILGVMSFPAVYNNDNIFSLSLKYVTSDCIVQSATKFFSLDSVLVCSLMWVAQTLFFHKYQQCTTVFA